MKAKVYTVKKMLIGVFIALLAGVLSLVQANPVIAAEGTSFSVSPMYQRMILTPGERYQGAFKVAVPLDAQRNFDYKVTVTPYYPAKEEGGVDDYGDFDMENSSARNQIVDWIKIDNPTGVIEPNSEATISFTVTTPENAPAGGQYAAIMVGENLTSSTSQNQSSIRESIQMAHIVYAEVSGETIKKGQVIENYIPSFLLSGPLTATSKVRNEGNVHTDAEYTFQVWPLFSDEEICTNEESVAESMVLPDTERYHTETCNLPAVGIFRAKQTVKIFGETSVVETNVFICPLWLMIVVLIVIIAIIVWLVMRARSRKKKD